MLLLRDWEALLAANDIGMMLQKDIRYGGEVRYIGEWRWFPRVKYVSEASIQGVWASAYGQGNVSHEAQSTLWEIHQDQRQRAQWALPTPMAIDTGAA